MRTKSIFLFFVLVFSFVSCSNKVASTEQQSPEAMPVAITALDEELAKSSKAYFASGCFWCVEGVFESVKGVKEAISGYAGGSKENPTYEQVGSGNTGHAEAVVVYYDSTQVSYETLLKVYFASMDPTQVNGQGPDRGSAYRSIILYQNATEKQAAEDYISTLDKSGKYEKPISVEVKAFTKFWNAEDYHQNYIYTHPENPYVQHESIPRIKRFQKQFPDLIKADKNLANK